MYQLPVQSSCYHISCHRNRKGGVKAWKRDKHPLSKFISWTTRPQGKTRLPPCPRPLCHSGKASASTSAEMEHETGDANNEGEATKHKAQSKRTTADWKSQLAVGIFLLNVLENRANQNLFPKQCWSWSSPDTRLVTWWLASASWDAPSQTTTCQSQPSPRTSPLWRACSFHYATSHCKGKSFLKRMMIITIS